MSISVYIPTDGERLSKLDDIINIYNNGTLKPDEIVISAFCVVKEEHLTYLRDIHNKKYDNVKIYAGKNLGTTAENLNYALKFTIGDLVLFHDPLKYPSVVRVEMVKQLFETQDINVLHHPSSVSEGFADRTFSLEHMDIIRSDEIYRRYFPLRGVKNSWICCRNYGQEFSIIADMSSICTTREMLTNIKWKERHECEYYRGNSEGFGYEFSMEILYTYNKSLIIGSPLTVIK
jgi:hypothetical protein